MDETLVFITGLPKITYATQGGTLSWTVEVSGGTAPYTYEWKNGADLVFQVTEPTLQLTTNANQATLDNVEIICTVTDSLGEVITGGTLISFSEPPGVEEDPEPSVEPLVFTTELPSITPATQGGAINFTVEVSGGVTPYTYEWSNSLGTNFPNITTPTMNLTSNANKATLDNVGFTCKVTDAEGTIISSTTQIQFPADPLTFTTGLPATTNVVVGQPLRWTVTPAGGSGTLTYVWKNGAGVVQSSTTNTFELSASATTGFSGVTIVCEVTDVRGTTAETRTAITVVNALAFNPGLEENKSVTTGDTVEAEVVVSGGSSPYTFAWSFDDVIITEGIVSEGAESLINFEATTSGILKVVVTDSQNRTLEDTMDLGVISSGLPGGGDPEPIPNDPLSYVTALPATTQAEQGGTLSWTIEVTGGTAPYTYKWENSEGLVFTSVTTPTLQLTTNANKATLNGIGIISTVTDSMGSIVSSQTVIEFEEEEIPVEPLVYTTGLEDITPATQGQPLSWTVAVEGGVPPYTYKWENNLGTVFNVTTPNLPLTSNANQTTLDNIEIISTVTDSVGTSVTDKTTIRFNYTEPSEPEDEGTPPDYYYVLTIAGQSNSMSYGDGIPLPDTLDATDPRIKQMARRSIVKPGGRACTFNEPIPLDHCPHDVEDLTGLNHPRAILPKQYGTVSQSLHIAKRLLDFIPSNAGILVVPCSRGGSAFTAGADGTYDPATGATSSSMRWGIGKPLYQDMVARTKAALDLNPQNKYLGVIWMQGEFDLQQATTYQNQPALFNEMMDDFETQMTPYASRIVGGKVSNLPWIFGGTTYYWKETYKIPYSLIYGNYANLAKEKSNVLFVPLSTDSRGVNIPTNVPAEDPDNEAENYFGAASRTSGNWVSANRPTHFSSPARRGVIADKLSDGVALLNEFNIQETDIDSSLTATADFEDVTYATQGGTLNFSVTPVDGIAPYSYSWRNSNGLIFTAQTGASLPLTANANSNTLEGLSIIATVTDKQGMVVEKATRITFAEEPVEPIDPPVDPPVDPIDPPVDPIEPIDPPVIEPPVEREDDFIDFRDAFLKTNGNGLIPERMLIRDVGKQEVYGLQGYTYKWNKRLMANISYFLIEDPNADVASMRYTVYRKPSGIIYAEFKADGLQSLAENIDMANGNIKHPIYLDKLQDQIPS